MIKIKVASLALLALFFFTTVALEEYQPAQGQLQVIFPDSNLRVSLYSIPSLSELVLRFQESSPITWEPEEETDLAEASFYCAPALYYRSLPKADIYITIDLVHSPQTPQLTTCANSKFTSFSIKTTESEVSAAFLQALSLLAVKRNEISKPVILFDSNFERKIQAGSSSDCGDFYFDDNGLCSPCIFGCTTCSNSQTCEVCYPGDLYFYSYWKNQQEQCSYCAWYECITCLTEETCGLCLPGYLLTGDEQCVKCSDIKCKKCTEVNICEICYEGYSPNPDTGVCENCEIHGCEQCQTKSSCDKCYDGLYVDEQSCKQCGNKCKTCQDQETCTECYEGHLIESGKCSKCPPGCEKCSSSSECDNCALEYFKDDADRCRPCEIFCKECNEESCLACLPGFFLNDENNICTPCSAYCGECSDLSNCFFCTEGLLINGFCIKCIDNCDLCVDNDCFMCNQGYYLGENPQICIPCEGFGCKACTESECEQCFDNFYLDPDAKTCKKCGNGCELCQGPFCYSCGEGYYLEEGSCFVCDDENCAFCSENSCIECKEEFNFDDEGKCASCQYGCKVCDDEGCKQCYKDFYMDLSDNLCYSCSFGCQNCESVEICHQCYNGFYLGENKDCQYCDWDCEICVDDQTCIVCYERYFVNQDYRCENCAHGCRNCKSQDLCIDCDSGFFKVENECINCLPKCEICVDEYTCEKCFDGFYLFEDQCVQCPDFCEKCNENAECLECQPYYFLNDNSLCIHCHEGCETCEEFETCYWCISGYFLNGDFCDSCINNCINCQNYDTCDQCNRTYYAYTFDKTDGSTATECKKCMEGCDICDETYCYECSAKYFYDSSLSQCSPCMDNCESCFFNEEEENLKCEWCFQGFYENNERCRSCGEYCNSCDEYSCYECLPTFYSNDQGECTPCIDNCQECWGSDYCDVCQEGFIYDGLRNRCTQCNENCLKCDNDKFCYACDDYYYAVEGECKICGDYCVNCNDNECIKCDYGFYLDAGVCHYCPYSCESCSSEAYCETCYTKYYLKVADDKLSATCEYCSISGCAICSGDLCSKCEDSFFLEDGICKSCTEGCKDCDESKTCLTCRYGFYLNPDSACSKCMRGCLDCYIENKDQVIFEICIECDYYYFTTEDYTCENCIDKCEYCYDTESCDQCEQGYFFSMNEKACIKCKKHCSVCSNSKTCDICEYGYYWNEKDTQCKACSFGCGECDKDSCTVCSYEFYLEGNKCVHCSPNCAYCDSQDNCQGCYEGFYFNEESRKCEICTDYCKECYYSECFTCFDGFYLEEVITEGDIAELVCTSCPDNCYYCEEGLCYECNYGYFVDDNFDCEGCQENCDICDSKALCYECSSGYYYNKDNSNCESCPEYCAECDGDECIYCYSGYFFNTETSECQACSGNCDYCDDYGVCLECSYKFYLDSDNSCTACKSDLCVKCTSENDCRECEIGYFPDDKGNCKKCVNNCDYCDFQTECRECSFNFFKGSKGECLKCPEYCSGCKNYNFCDECAEGFIHNNDGTCSQCSRDCRYCDSIDKCVECMDGFYLDGNSKCSRCKYGCIYCSSEESCESCDWGFYLDSGFCAPCTDPGCYDCSSSSCFNCYWGYLLNQNDFTCEACLENCRFCPLSTECAFCYEGYYLSDDKTQCLPCADNCWTCTNGEICDSCIQGTFMKEAGKCFKCKDNCIECDASKCFFCEDGFYVNQGGSCAKCSKNCAKCDEKTICQGCFEGFYIDSTGTCSACKGNCGICLDSKSCIACSRGYLLAPDNTCSKCKKNCAYCDDSGVCSECLDGFLLDDLSNKCITCSIPDIKVAKITGDYKSLKIEMVSVIDNQNPDCENTITTVESFGDDWKCKVDGKSFIVNFGNNYAFNDETLFSVYVEGLFKNPCNYDPIYDITATFEEKPPQPKGKVKGLPVVSLGCAGSDLEYYIDEVKGSGSMPVTVSWIATVDPTNDIVTQYVETLNTNRILIPISYFDPVDSTLTIESVITNSMKKSASSSYTTQLLGAKQMNLKIDKGTELEIYSSEDLELNVKLVDSCGAENSASYVWTITSSTSTQFIEGQVLNADGKRKLKLQKNFLTPGNVFELTVTATSGSITGSASIILTTLLDDLIAIVNKQNGNISPLQDLVINGTASYDPNNMGYELKYEWSCKDPITEDSCVGSDGTLLVSNENQAILNLPATRLVGGAYLEIYFTVKTSEDSRETATLVSLYVYEGLSTNIQMTFNQDKIEPSDFLYIKADVFSKVLYTLQWTQVQGTYVQLETDYTADMLFWPYSFNAGETYEFVLVATEELTGAFATASVTFSVNQPAACFSSLTVSPDTGVALVDDFKLSIDSCTDLDETDVPLSYIFYLFPTDFAWIGISRPQSFNSITFKTFEGEFYALVRVCDSLGGCNWYFIENILTVTEYTGKRSLSDEDPIAFYESLVGDNEEATVMYAISIITTFTLTLDQVDYIYNDALAYVESETIDVDSIDMMMKFIMKIIENQSSTLNYNKIEEYTQIIIELINNCTEDLTSDINDLAQDLAISIIEFGLYDIKYITLANEFLDSVTTLYSANMLPGNTIINSATSNFVYYKFREVSANYENKTIGLDNNITVTIESLPFESTDLIDINIKSFPDEGGYSNILDITFTKYGIFKDNVLEVTEEKVMDLTTSTVLFEIPGLKNVTGGWACQYYTGNSWKSDGCEFEEETDTGIKMRISHTTMFRLYDASKIPSDDSNSSETYAPIILVSGITMLLIVGYTILSFIDRKMIKAEKKSKIQVITNKDIKFDDSVENIDQFKNNKEIDSPTIVHKKSILTHHLLLGIFTNDLDFIKADRVLTFCLIIATQFTIQGALIGFDAIQLHGIYNMAAIAAISVGFTIPFHIIANLRIRSSFRKGCSALVVLGFITFASDIALVVAMALELTSRYYTWIGTFFWSLLFEALLEVAIMAGRHMIASS